MNDDPANWPTAMNNNARDYLAMKGPPNIPENSFPRNGKGLCFSKFHCKRKLLNGESVERPWIIYSKSADKIYCFYCKLFIKNASMALSTSGFNDWSNVHTRLCEHEKSKNHMEATCSYWELHQRLCSGQTIDKKHEKIINEQAKHWQQVFKRLVAIVQFLAEKNLAFRGTNEDVRNESVHNGNFLGLVELVGKFDPVLDTHLRKIKTHEIHNHYLGKDTQNELLDIMATATLNEILKRVKAAKYYAIILDCTPDISHQEQMSLIIRYVSDGNLAPPGVYEHFIKFIQVQSSTGEDLYKTLLSTLKEIDLKVQDIRGQGYDNGSNMKGHTSGVQARLLKENSRAFFVPCACHNYNLLLGDVAKCCPDAITFFGILQAIYTLFSASTKRWAVFKKYVPGLSVKPLSITRLECRIDSVKAIRYQVGEVYDALVEISEITNEPMVKAEAESLANQLKDYKFCVSLIFWYEVLFKVNYVSKKLQGETKDINEGMESFEKLLSWLRNYREEGFNDVLLGANELAESIELPTESRKFYEKKIRRRKRMFLYEANDQSYDDPKETYRAQCFNLVLDQAIQSLKSRFKQLKNHVKLFGFINSFQDIPKKEIREHTSKLEAALTITTIRQDAEGKIVTEKNKDVDGYMLAEELEALKTFLRPRIKPYALFEHLIENNRFTTFPNVFIALRIYLTMPITVASGERSFSKLKLIKTYLRSTVSQERLNSSSMLSIESEIAKAIDFENILNDFANK